MERMKAQDFPQALKPIGNAHWRPRKSGPPVDQTGLITRMAHPTEQPASEWNDSDELSSC
jgi:hypothetical protein